MSSSTLVSIHELSQADHQLNQLFEQAQKKKELEAILNQQVPPALRHRFKVVQEIDGIQTLLVHSPTIAGRLRYLCPRLLQITQNVLPHIHEIIIKVVPKTPEISPVLVERAPISQYGVQKLAELQSYLHQLNEKAEHYERAKDSGEEIRG